MSMKSIVGAGILLAFAATTATTANAEERVAIGTGGTGGLFYVVGAGMAEVINKHLPGVTARAEVTGASVENIRRVTAGQEQIGFSSSSTLYAASVGNKPFSKKLPVAAIAYLYPAVLQIAALNSTNIKKLDDLKSATVNLGPPGSNSAILAQRVLTAYGVFNASNSRFLSYSEGTNAMLNATLDATCALAGAPTAAMIDLSTQRDVTFLSVSKDRVGNLLKQYPFYQIADIPAGTYRGQDKPVSVINDPAVLFTSTNVSDKLVYDITKAIFDNLAEIHAIHPQAKKILLSTATHTPIALAPGAKKFFDEQMAKMKK